MPQHRVDNSPERSRIVKALTEGQPIRAVAEQFGFAPSAIMRFKKNYLSKSLKKRAEQRQLKDADVIGERLEGIVGGLDKLQRALDREFTSAEDPNEYDLSLRGSEIDVIVEESTIDADGKLYYEKIKGTLQQQLDRLHGKPISVISRREDLRKLLVASCKAAGDLLVQIARVHGVIAPPGVNINTQINIGAWEELRLEPWMLSHGGPVNTMMQLYTNALSVLSEEERQKVFDEMKRLAEWEQDPQRDVTPRENHLLEDDML
jgi:transposase-like protein